MRSAAGEHLSVRCYSASPGSHDHDHFQILVGLEGTLDLEVAGRGQRIGVGDSCVVPPGERHDFESQMGARCLVLDSQSSGWIGLGPSQHALTLSLARYLADACALDLPRAQLIGPTLLLESWRSQSPHRTRQRRTIHWNALAEWARQRWATQHIDVADMARQVHLSPSQFAARCQAECGQSAQRWLRDLQLDQAQDLRARGLPMTEVARRSGYSSPSAVTAALRRRTR